MLFWQPPARARPAGVHGAAPIAPALVLGLDLSGYRDSAAGRYVPAHMPLSMQAIRSLSAVTIAVRRASAPCRPPGRPGLWFSGEHEAE